MHQSTFNTILPFLARFITFTPRPKFIRSPDQTPNTQAPFRLGIRLVFPPSRLQAFGSVQCCDQVLATLMNNSRINEVARDDKYHLVYNSVLTVMPEAPRR